MGKQAEEQQKFGEQVSEPGPGGHSDCSSPVRSLVGGGPFWVAAWRCGLWAELQADTNLGAVGWLECGGRSASCLLWATYWGGRRSSVHAESWTRLCWPLQVAYFQSALDKLNEAIKLAKVMTGESLAGPRGSWGGPWLY